MKFFALILWLFCLVPVLANASDKPWYTLEGEAELAELAGNDQRAARLYGEAMEAYLDDASLSFDPDQLMALVWPHYQLLRASNARKAMDDVLANAMDILEGAGPAALDHFVEVARARADFQQEVRHARKAASIMRDARKMIDRFAAPNTLSRLELDYEYWSFMIRRRLIRSEEEGLEALENIYQQSLVAFPKDTADLYYFSYVAPVYLALGDREKAVTMAEAGIELLEGSMRESLLAENPELRSLPYRTAVLAAWAAGERNIVDTLLSKISQKKVFSRYQPVIHSQPDYSFRAAVEGYDGRVDVELVVDAKGRVETVFLMSSNGNAAFENDALTAIRSWIFPYSEDGMLFRQTFFLENPGVQRLNDWADGG